MTVLFTILDLTFNDHGDIAKQYKIGTNITDNNSQFEIRDVTAGVELAFRNDDSAGSVCINKTADNDIKQIQEVVVQVEVVIL